MKWKLCLKGKTNKVSKDKVEEKGRKGKSEKTYSNPAEIEVAPKGKK
jgi:hypothetical protein